MPTTKIASAGATFPDATLQATALAATYGGYTGDDTANRAIAHGLGRTPKHVWIGRGASGPNLFRLMSGLAYILSNATALAVTPPNTTNFFVGNATSYINSANETGGGYYWIAIG